MFRCLFLFFLSLSSCYSFGQVVLTQTHSDATIGLDRKAWAGLGVTGGHSDGYAHDFTLPARTNPCQQISAISVVITLTGYSNNNFCPHSTIYYNLFYGCGTYTGGATCLPANNLIAEPNFPPNTGPPPFNFGNPLGSPINPNIVPDFGGNLSVDVVPVSNPGCNPVTNGFISYQYTITVTVTITDNTPTVPALTTIGPFCINAASTALNTTQSGVTGQWSGPGVVGNSFNPVAAGEGNHTLIFAPDADQCAIAASMMVVVNSGVTPTFGQIQPICTGETFLLPSTSDNGITGTWSPAINNTATTTYTFTPTVGQCASTQTMTVTVNPDVVPTFMQVQPICTGESFTLPNTSENGINGTWSPAINNTATTTYTFTPTTGQCASTQTMTVTVNPGVTPTFMQVQPICTGESFVLPNTSDNGINGTWSPAINNTATTTYTFTPTTGQCASTQTMTVTVNPGVTPAFMQVPPICSGGSFVLPNTSDNGIIGTWSPAINNTTTTTYTFTPNAGQCASTQTMTVTVNTSVTPTFTQVQPICTGQSFTLPTTSDNGILGVWSPAINNMTTTTYTFTPNVGQCAVDQNMTVTVNPAPVANVPTPFEICVLLVPPSLISENIGTVTTQITGGNPGLTVNWFFDAAATQPIPNINNVFLAVPPPSTVYASVSNGSCSSSTVPVGINITQSPVINPPGNVTACQSYTLPPITGTNLTGNEAYYTSPNGTGTQYLAGQIITSTITLFIFAGSGTCSDQEQFTITISPPPTANEPSNPIELCAASGNSAVFNLTNLNDFISGGSGTVNWFSNAAGTNPIPNPTAFSSSSITVYASVTIGTCTSMLVPINLQVNPAPVVNLAVTQAINCATSNDGAISTTISNVSGSFTFDWNINALDGQQNPSNLGSGTYSVTVTATSTGCIGTGSITLSAPTTISLNCVQQSPISSIGSSDGIATVQVSGGTPGYTISWTGAANGSQILQTFGTATITDLAAGLYNIVVTDDNGCTQSCSFSIGTPDCNMSVTALEGNPSCNGAADGFINLNIVDATGILNFAWNDNTLDGLADPAGLIQGTYIVTVTDETGCTAITSVTLTDPPALNIVCAQQNPVSSIGGADGRATIEISGGTASYTIAWSGASSGTQAEAAPGTVALEGLMAGAYEVVVTDTNGCTQTCSFSIGTHDCDLAVSAVGTNPGCNGASTGSIILSVTGATGELVFTWNENGLNGIQSPTGLMAGNYMVTVTDGGGCTTSTSVTLTDPPALNVVCAQQNPVSSIGGADGRATIELSGGTAGYTISWIGASSGTQAEAAPGTAILEGLMAGEYEVVVTDANGCTQTCSFTIDSHDCDLLVTAVGTNPLCNGATTGSISLTVTGALGELVFIWNDADLNGIQSPTGLMAGNYMVTVTDGGGCTTSTSVTLTDPPALNVVCAQQNPVSSIGGADGRATIELSGGTAGYTISWSGASSGTQEEAAPGTVTLEGLMAGAYEVIVTDANGCTQTCSFSIGTHDCDLAVSAVGTNPGCNGASTGSIILSVTGATGELVFTWNENGLNGIQSPTGLMAGNYMVTVTDGGGCTTSTSVTLTDPPALNVVCAQQNPVSSIGGADGRATIELSGGTAGYTISWIGASSGTQAEAAPGTAILEGLMAGEYEVVVTDANGCTQTCSFTIDSHDCDLLVTAVGTNPLCNGATTGSISLTVTGALGELVFIWNDADLNGIQSPTGLMAGNYMVTVTDGGGCTTSTSVTLTDPPALNVVCAQQNPVSSIGGADGRATIELSGGTAGYTISWIGASSGTQAEAAPGTAILEGLMAGEYEVVVTDANGCTQTCSFTIDSHDCDLLVTAVGTNPLCNGATTGSISLTVTGALGELVFIWNDADLNGIQSPAGLMAGNYTVTVTDNAGCSSSLMVTLSEPEPISFEVAGISAYCFDPLNGGISVNSIEGGVTPFEISYDGSSFLRIGMAPAQIDGISPGNYTITLQDANGCMSEASVTVPAAPVYVLDLGPDHFVIPGESVRLEGIANFVIDSVVWSPTLFLSDITSPVTFSSPQNSTAYRLVAFDENGCWAEDEIWVYVEQRGSVFIPNAFSPNNDGINDTFKIFGNDNVSTLRSFSVFDRWGGKVFEIVNISPNDNSAAWDGSHRGKTLDAGVYLYYVEVEYNDGTTRAFKGEVALIR